MRDLPGSLSEVLDALENDQEFLLRGGVFTPDLIDTYIAYKRRARSIRSRCARTVRVLPLLRRLAEWE